MLKEEKQWVVDTIKAELAAAIAPILIAAAHPKPAKPVEVDIDGIVKLVLDKIKLIPQESPHEPPKPVAAKAKAEAPKKGKEK